MQVEIINRSKNELPQYETPQSAGVDLRADIEEEITLQPLERKLIGTGLYIALQPGFEAQIRPRSGMAYKHGLTVLNSPGTIDADYRGEIKILMVNISNEAYTVKPAERIAQMVIAQHEQAEWAQVEVLNETIRGAGGFGSTGKN
ncbi:MAG: dUTP diphosphatase [Bacteroidetes bacterium]|nr:MAG: dUTP diphosphatase [Bacteroidota bacterium]